MTAATLTLPDGIHLGVPFAAYLSIDAISNSGALAKIRRSAAYYFATRDADRSGTPDMRVGSVVNDLVLCPEVFEDRIVVCGDCCATLVKGGVCGNAGKVVVDGRSYCGRHAPEGAEPDPRITVTEEQLRRAQDMAAAVHADPDASALLARCDMREVTMVWTDPATGLRCKGRIDAIEGRCPNPFALPKMIDLKKSIKAHPDHFPGEIQKRNYHGQLAFYDSGWHALTGTHTEPHIIAVNDQKGDDVHEVGTYQIIADAIEAGRDANRKALAFIRACQDSGQWPGFGARPMSIPAWALGADEEDNDDGESVGEVA